MKSLRGGLLPSSKGRKEKILREPSWPEVDGIGDTRVSRVLPPSLHHRPIRALEEGVALGRRAQELRPADPALQ